MAATGDTKEQGLPLVTRLGYVRDALKPIPWAENASGGPSMSDTVQEAIDALPALCAEVEALRKDAERLREVLLHQTKATLYGFGISLKDEEETERATNNYIAFCRAAIDAAKEPK